jgi:hypothetical protein
MTDEQLEMHLYMRTLRFDHLSSVQMRERLRQWLVFCKWDGGVCEPNNQPTFVAKSMTCDYTWLIAPILLQLSECRQDEHPTQN